MKHTSTPQQFQICQTCEELFDDGKYYVSTLDYNKLKSSHDELLEAAKLALSLIRDPDVVTPKAETNRQVCKTLSRLEKAIQKAEGK